MWPWRKRSASGDASATSGDDPKTRSWWATWRTKTTKPAKPLPPPGLEERAKLIAKTLGVFWDGLGTVEREPLPNGQHVWRVHDEWGNLGGSAVFDAVSCELVSIEESPTHHDGPWPPLPERLVPSDDELCAFARARLEAIGWTQLGEMTAERVPGQPVWSIRAVVGECAVRAEVRGRRGNLRVAGCARGG